MIIMHIVSYLAIIIVNALQYLFYYRSFREYEISTICLLAVTSVCNLIFGLIVN